MGNSVFEKTQTQKFALSEARFHKTRRRPRPLSDFGKQLIEKQKVRFTYGLSEKQLSNYVAQAITAPDPTKALHVAMESRLDSVIYRLGLASTRRAARQMASHGHVTVNGKKTTIPSQKIKVGDTVAVREGSKDSGLFLEIRKEGVEGATPNWLVFDVKQLSAQVKAEPGYNPSETLLDYPAVFEFYSR